ncbi:DUF4407 domain-containing protein [Dactylosporangium sp. NPDC000521]|uniref:DUF4407 domain-containing protein n=1 Tax=Dactylosporangium sp. NPDC000521 TaxID=3363975 RepID=UPI003699F5DC
MRDRNVGTTGRIPQQRAVPRRGLLLWLSGADVDTLSHTPRETRKFIGLGGIVLTTATLAAISATFALTLGARAPIWAAVPAGLLWGLAIMNLDRWLVTATQRRPQWYQNLLTALPRVVMALIIGAVISTPLVLWLFQREIDAQLNVIHQRRLDQHQQALLNDARFKSIPQLQASIAQNQAIANGTATGASEDPRVKELQAQYDDLNTKFQAAQASATCEFDGTCGTKTRGGGEAYRQKQAVADELRRQRDAVGRDLDQARNEAKTKQAQSASAEQATAAEQVKRDQAELDRLEALKKAEEDQFKADTANDKGLLAQLGALSELTDKNSTLRLAYLMLLLFITTIEVLPVLVKFLMNLAPATAYDKILEKAEATDFATAESRLSHRQERLEFEEQARADREKELIRERISRVRSIDDDYGMTGHVSTKPAETPTTRLMTWLLRRNAPTQPVGYTPWPDEEPFAGTTRINPPPATTARIDDDDEDRMTERWSFER